MGFPPPPARVVVPDGELTFDAWILAETDLLFGEWVEWATRVRSSAPAPTGMRIDTGYLRSSLPKAPVGGTGEVTIRSVSRYPTFDEKLAARRETSRQHPTTTPFDQAPQNPNRTMER